VLAQQVMMARVNFAPTLPAPLLNLDAWDGVAAARNRLLGFVRDAGVGNVVVLTGDIHSSWVADLKADFADPTSPVVATEFVGTSISSDFPPQFITAIQAALAHPSNAHVKFFDGVFRGYVRCEVTTSRWQTDYRAVDTVLAPSSSVSTLASFVVESGQPGAEPA
jgi:alkaline phosphatase D